MERKIGGAIQVIPPGLLGFLNLKNGGTAPVDMPSVLQPVLPLFDWYMQAKARDFTNEAGIVPETGATAIGSFDFQSIAITVPDGEIWWIEQYSIRTQTLQAGDEITVAPIFIRPILGVQSIYKVGESTFAEEGQFATCYASRPFFCPPGSTLGFAVETLVLGGGSSQIDVIGSLRYVPCPL